MKTSTDQPGVSKTQRYWLLGITIALLGWGGFLAVGSYLGGANLRDSVVRGFVVFGCTVAFVAFWWMLLIFRSRSTKADQEADVPLDRE